MNNSHTKFYWKVGKKTFHNKHKAVVEMDRSGSGIEWHPPSRWLSYNWEDPPKKDLWKIMVDRAKEIRQKYKYIRLWFSGGCDSQTVLECFLSNGIQIDEIFMHSSGVKQSDYEITDTAVPFLIKHKNALRNTKINHYTTKKEDYYDWHTKKHWETENGIYMAHSRLVGPVSSYKYGCKNMPGEINIICSTKSFLIYKNKNWYTYLPDYEFDGYYVPNTTYFFCQDPEIYHSQSYTLLLYIKKFFATEQWDNFTTRFNQENWNKGMQRSMNVHNNFLLKVNETVPTKSFKTPLKKIVGHNMKESYAWKFQDPAIINLWQKNIADLYDLKKYFNDENPWLFYTGCPGYLFSLSQKQIIDNSVLFPQGFNI
jgi:hypothetical protein